MIRNLKYGWPCFFVVLLDLDWIFTFFFKADCLGVLWFCLCAQIGRCFLLCNEMGKRAVRSIWIGVENTSHEWGVGWFGLHSLDDAVSK